MKQLLDLYREVLENGERREDRTGVGTISLFGAQVRYKMADGFPLVTTKKMSDVRWNGIVRELLWFLAGDTNNNTLKDAGVNIWNAWADENGELGPIYGHQWRKFGQYKFNPDTKYYARGYIEGVDQIEWLINELKTNPSSRRLIVSAWHPGQMKDMALPPCHTLFQFYVSNDDKLSLQLYQRSADLFLGVPYNIASYSLLLHMVAQVTGLKAHEFIHTIGDAHIYTNHIEQIQTQLSREPLPLPKLKINPEVIDIFSFTPGDFELVGYESHGPLAGKVAV
jgi:thymidylate synthase